MQTMEEEKQSGMHLRRQAGFRNQNAYTTCDHMHHYKEDYALMKNLGIKAYRFSLNWARILPEGTGRVNEKAIRMYRDMITCMKENGITPYITMFHWEFPQALYEKGGWLNPEVADWFGEYAKVVAERFPIFVNTLSRSMNRSVWLDLDI